MKKTNNKKLLRFDFNGKYFPGSSTSKFSFFVHVQMDIYKIFSTVFQGIWILYLYAVSFTFNPVKNMNCQNRSRIIFNNTKNYNLQYLILIKATCTSNAHIKQHGKNTQNPM